MKKQFLESHLNIRVFVYKNLHKNCWSVRDMKTGLIAFHCDAIIIKDAKFKVSKKGRQRVLKDRVKNVHAGVMGTTLSVNQDQDGWTNRVRYNPYETDTFILCERKPRYLQCRGGKRVIKPNFLTTSLLI